MAGYRRFSDILILVASLLLPSLAYAQEDGEYSYTIGELAAGNVSADTLKIEMNTPTTPAAAILGDDTISLTTLRSSADLYGQLLSGFGADGAIQPGMAFGGAPFWWIAGDETLADYRGKGEYLKRVLKKTQIGLATKSAPVDNENTMLLGLSASWQLIDSQDPRMFVAGEQCLAETLSGVVATGLDIAERARVKALRVLLAETPQIEREKPGIYNLQQTNILDFEDILESYGKLARYDALRDQYQNEMLADPNDPSLKTFDNDAYGKARDRCRKEYQDYLASQDSLVLTVATSFASTEGKLDDLDGEKTAVWLSFKSGRDGILGGVKIPVEAFVGFTFDEVVELDAVEINEATSVLSDQATLGVGTGYENDDESLDLQISWSSVDFADQMLSDTDTYRLSLSYSRRLDDYLWLEMRAGSTNSGDLEDASFAGLNLKLDTAAMLNN